MIELFQKLVDRVKLVWIVTGISVLFVIALQVLRLFDYNVLGRFQLLILPVLFLFSYGMPALSQERVAILPWNKYKIWYERLQSTVFSVVFLIVGIVLMGFSIVVNDSFLFYMCFFLFNFSGFYLYHLAHFGEMSEDYMETKMDIDIQKDRYNNRF